MGKILKKNIFWLVSGLGFLFLRLSSLFEPYWYGDEGIYLTIGQAIRKGVVPYLQIHDNKPPLLYYLAALGQTVFGFRLILLLMMAVTIFVFYKLVKLILKDGFHAKIAVVLFIILTSIPLLEGNIANSEIFMLLPTIAGIYFIFKGKTNLNYFWAGLLLGIAFTLKMPVIIELIFIGIWIIVSKFKKEKIRNIFENLVMVAGGFWLPISIWMIYFWSKGAISEFFFASLWNNFGYLSSWQTGTHSGSATEGGLLTRFLILSVYWLIIAFLYKKKYIEKNVSFVFMWAGATFFGSLLSTRPYPHYLIQVLPTLCLIVPIIVWNKSGFGKTLGLLWFLVLGLAIVNYKFYFYRTISYYNNFYSYALGRKSDGDYRAFFGKRVNEIYKIAEYIKQNTKNDEKIFVWGDEPDIYALSDRLPAGRYTVAYHVIDFDKSDETITKIKAELPTVVVYYSMENRSFEGLEIILAKFYKISQSFGDGIIYTRR